MASTGIVGRLGAMRVKIRPRREDMKNTDQDENADPCEDRICRWECLKVNIKQGFFRRENRDIHQPNTLAKRV